VEGCELGYGVGGRVDEGVDACSVVLGEGAADLEVEGGDGRVESADVGVEVGLGDVVGEGFAAGCVCGTSC